MGIRTKYELLGILNDLLLSSNPWLTPHICPSLQSTGSNTTHAVQNTCTLFTDSAGYSHTCGLRPFGCSAVRMGSVKRIQIE